MPKGVEHDVKNKRFRAHCLIAGRRVRADWRKSLAEALTDRTALLAQKADQMENPVMPQWWIDLAAARSPGDMPLPEPAAVLAVQTYDEFLAGGGKKSDYTWYLIDSCVTAEEVMACRHGVAQAELSWLSSRFRDPSKLEPT